MKIRIALLAAALVSSFPALAATAFWTGKQQMVRTVTGQMATNCEYRFAGNAFWRVFEGSCPSSIEVQ